MSTQQKIKKDHKGRWKWESCKCYCI